MVTPRAGVWIEMLNVMFCDIVCRVTPRAGVWIEISEQSKKRQDTGSLPVRECGLKSHLILYNMFFPGSLPVRECGLKSLFDIIYIFLSQSLPVRECGLKYLIGIHGNTMECHSPCGSVD